MYSVDNRYEDFNKVHFVKINDNDLLSFEFRDPDAARNCLDELIKFI